MQQRTNQFLFSCIVLSLVFLSCQLSPFSKPGDTQNDNKTIDQPTESEEGGGFVKTLLPDGLPGITPKNGNNPYGGLVQPQGFELLGQLGGSSMTVFVKDDLAIIGQGPRVVTLDISNPASPILLGESVILSGLVMGIEVKGDFAYTTTMYGGLNILDISDPALPEIVSSVAPDIPGCDGITIDNNIAYMACNPSGLFIVDIEKPEKPKILYQAGKPAGAVFSIARVGNYVYLTNMTNLGLDIFNAKNPNKPVQEGTFLYSDIPDVVSQGGYFSSVKPCGKNLCLGTFHDGLIVVGLDDPANPKVIGKLGGMTVDGISVLGNTVYLTDAIEGVHVVDVADPENPIKTGFLPTDVAGWELIVSEHGERGLFIHDDHLYITDQAYGLTIVDIANKAAPARIGEYMTPLPHVLFEIRLNGNNAIVMGNNSGMRSVDISDPSHPRELAYDDERKDLNLQYPTGLEIRDNHAFISDGNYPFHIYDISDPAKPRQTGSVSDFAASDGAFDIALNEDFAYLSGWGLKDAFYPGTGIWVIDIKDPNSPEAVKFVDVANERWLLSISNGYLYTLDTNIDEKKPEPLSLRVFDLSNPGVPEEITAIPIPEAQNLMEKALLTDGDRLYIGLPMIGVIVFDISKPTKPERLTTIPLQIGMTDMIKDRQYLIISGATAYDITNINKPEYAGTTGILQAWDFAIKKDLVFVTTTFQGLYVFRFKPIR